MVLAREEAAPLEQETAGTDTLVWIGLTTVLYFLAAGYLVSLSLDVLTPDAVSYLRIAQYYAHGRFDLAVNSCWGPLLSWLLVPAALLKVDLPLAVRIVQVLSGFGFAAAVSLLTRRFTGGRGAAVGFMAGALLALPMVPYSITPDLTLAFLMTLYFALTAPLLSGGSLSWALGAGLVAGAAFLTKHYALPFVIAHLGLTLAVRWFLARRKLVEGPVARPILVAAAAFLAVALPWIAVMSIHDGSLTFSSAGRYAQATTYASRHHTMYPDHRLQEPREGRLVVSENRLEGKYGLPDYPPLTSVAGLKDRAGHLKYYGPLAIKFTKSADLLGLLLCAPLIVLLRATRSTVFLSDRRGACAVWACFSVVLYTAGYVMTNVEERLLWPTWGVLLSLAVAVFVFPPTDGSGWALRGKTAAAAPWVWGLLLVGSVGFNATDSLWNCGERAVWYTDCRKAAETLPLKGHFAVNGGREELFAAYAMAYWSNTPLLGSLEGTSPDELARELEPFGDVQTLIVSNANLVSRLKQHRQFEWIKTVDAPSGKRSYSLFAFHPTSAGRRP